MNLRGLPALILLFASAPLPAVDLMDIYREARINDTRTAAARAHYKAMQERVPQARAGQTPGLELNANRRRATHGSEWASPRQHQRH